MKKVLVLGAGLVTRPLVHYLLDQKDLKVIVASRTVSKASELIAGHSNGEALSFDIEKNPNDLERLVPESDCTISMLPYAHHVTVAKICIKHKKHLVTTSYVSDAMKALDEQARKAGIIILNELGLDPGIDHMSAMKIIHRIQDAGGKVTSFYSYCGGLPAPEANTNPFGYKFSWSPRGVVLAAKNDAKYLKDGRVVEIPGKELFDHYWTLTIEGLGDFEAYPNRNSLPYIDLYGLKGISSMYRGTLRNVGWCRTWKKIADMGFLNDTEKYDFSKLTYKKFVGALINSKEADVKQALARYLKLDASSDIIGRLEWLGLFEDKIPALKEGSALDLLVAILLEKLEYKKGERDMIIMQHEFGAEYKDGKKEKTISTLVGFGIPNGDSIMSRTVGLPAAIGANLIVHGKIHLTGVQIPVVPEIYEPIMEELGRFGIEFKEKVERI